MPPFLRLFEDTLSAHATLDLAAAPRMIFVVHGSVTIGDRSIADDETWHGEDAATLKPGEAGATCWRWELANRNDGRDIAGNGRTTRGKLSAQLDTLPSGDLLLRGDSVAFPPGGCAYLHRHQGPGIRCLIEGGIRIDTHGASTSYGPGGAWFESGPEPVFAQAAQDRPSRFITRDGAAARIARQELDPVRQPGRQGEAEVADLQDLCRRADQLDVVTIGGRSRTTWICSRATPPPSIPTST
jgi:hypothetical protein